MARQLININNGALGSVVSSTLTDAAFSNINGTNWALCDGRSIVGSKLNQLFGLTNAPNLQGVFLRGSGTQNISGITYSGQTAGTFETDIIQDHKHATSDPGHAHLYIASTAGGGLGALGFEGANPFNGTPTATATTGLTVQLATNGNETIRKGSETRPVNFAINYYIKIS